MQIKTKIVSSHTDSKPVKQEVNGTVILPPFVFPDVTIQKVSDFPWIMKTSVFQSKQSSLVMATD